MLRVVVSAASLAAIASAAACASILGIDPVRFDDTEAGSGDAASDALASDAPPGTDGGTFDGAIEASLFDAPLSDAACIPCATSTADPCGIVCDAPPATEFLEVGSGYIFFGSRTKLERIQQDGGKRTTLRTGEIGGIAFHAPTNVIAWTIPSENRVVARESAGEGAEKSMNTQPNGQMHAKHLVMNDTQLIYFQGADSPFGGGQGYACTISTETCLVAEVFQSDSRQEVVAAAQARGLDAAVPWIAWRTRNTGAALFDAGALYAALGSTPLEPHPTVSYNMKKGIGTAADIAFAVDEQGFVYWTDQGATGTDVYKQNMGAPSGSSVLVLNVGTQPVASIAAGGGAVYLTEPSPPGKTPQDYKGEIVQVGTPTPRYTDRPNPGRIVQNQTGIYWVDRGNPPQTPSLIMRGKR